MSPPDVLALDTRASRRLRRWDTLEELLAASEMELLAIRGLGEKTLSEIRRGVVEYVLRELLIPRSHRQWRALAATEETVWEVEPQARTLAEVVAEYLELLGRYPLRKRRRQVTKPKRSASLAQIVRSYFSPLNQRERRILAMRCGPLRRDGMTLGEIAREFDLSRERIRQIIVRSNERLSSVAVREARRPTVRVFREAFAEPEAVLTEEELDHSLRERLRRPHAQTGPFIRSLLHCEDGFETVGPRTWMWSGE